MTTPAPGASDDVDRAAATIRVESARRAHARRVGLGLGVARVHDQRDRYAPIPGRLQRAWRRLAARWQVIWAAVRTWAVQPGRRPYD